MHSRMPDRRSAAQVAAICGAFCCGALALLALAFIPDATQSAESSPAAIVSEPRASRRAESTQSATVAFGGPQGASRPAVSTPVAVTEAPEPWNSADGVPAIELVLEWGSDSEWHAKLVNRDTQVVDIVLPGDGSDLDLRSPIVKWEVMTDDGPVLQHPVGCGNYNALIPEDVVALSPGDSVAFGRPDIPYLRVPKRGAMTVSLTYVHDPKMEWSHGSFGPNDEPSMTRVRASAPLSLHSNAFRVERDESRALRVSAK